MDQAALAEHLEAIDQNGYTHRYANSAFRSPASVLGR